MSVLDFSKKTGSALDSEIKNLENKLSLVRENIVSIKKDIEETNAILVNNAVEHANRVKKLKLNDNEAKEEIYSNLAKINNDLLVLADRQDKFHAEQTKNKEAIFNRLEELKERRRVLLEKENETDIASFEKEKKELENQFAELSDIKIRQEEEFDAKMSELKADYDRLLEEKRSEIALAKEKLEIRQKEALEEQRQLEETIALEMANQKADNERMVKEQEELVSKMMKEKEESYSNLSDTLSSAQGELNALIGMKEKLLTDIDRKKTNYDNEYNNLSIAYEKENNELINEYNLKLAELSSTQSELDSLIKNHRHDYEDKTKKIDEVTVLLEDKTNAKKQSMIAILKDLDASLKSQNAECVMQLDRQLETAVSNRRKELETLKYNLQKEEENLKNRNDYYKERLLKKEEEYKNSIEESNSLLTDLNNNFLSNEASNAVKKNELVNTVEKLKNAHYFAVNQKIQDNKDIFETKKAELSEKENEYVNRINDVRSLISEQDNENNGLRLDLEALANEFERRKAELTARHENGLSDIAAHIENIKGQIADLRNKAEEENRKYESEVNSLNELEQSKRDAYEANLLSIEEDFRNRKAQLEAKNNEDLELALKQYDNALADIDNKYQQNVGFMRALFEDKKSEYDEAKETMNEFLTRITKESEDKLNTILAQRNDVISSIENLKETSRIEDENHTATLGKMDELHLQQMKELEYQQHLKMEELINEFKSKKDALEAELNEVVGELNSRQSEKDTLTGTIEAKTRQYEIDIKTLESDNAKEKNAALENLAAFTKEYEDLLLNQENFEKETAEDLNKRRELIRSYEDEINVKIEALKKQKMEDYDAYVSLLNEKYNAQHSVYEQQRAEIASKYDEQIETIRKQYDLKVEQYNSLINDINSQKEALENENKGKYDQEVDYTGLLQTRLDDQVRKNDEHRAYLNGVIENKRAAMAEMISRIKEQYSEELANKTEVGNRYVANMNEKLEFLRNEVSNLENEIVTKTNEFEEYAAKQNETLVNMKNEQENIIGELFLKLEEIKNKAAEAKKLHNERIFETKKQIADSMSEYDNLLRNEDAIITAETADTGDLEEAAEEFKNRIARLENSHKELLANIEYEKAEVIRKYAEEMEFFSEDGKAKTEALADELASIEAMYDAMILEEKNKSDSIESQLKTVYETHKKEAEEIAKINEGLPEEYESMLENVKEEFNSQMKIYSEQFMISSNAMKEEFEQLTALKDVLSKKVSDILLAYTTLDDEILRGKTNLQIATRKMMNEILVKAKQEARKIDLSRFDIMN